MNKKETSSPLIIDMFSSASKIMVHKCTMADRAGQDDILSIF